MKRNRQRWLASRVGIVICALWFSGLLQSAPFRGQQIVTAEALPLTLPALIGKEASPLLRLRVETLGSEAVSLTGLQVTLEGTLDRLAVSTVGVYRGSGENGGFPASELVVVLAPGEKGPLAFSLDPSSCQLKAGSNEFWIACRLDERADIDRRIGVRCGRLTFSNGEAVDLEHAVSLQRIGVALRKGGDDGVATYRIPGLATTNKGTLIGVYDVRRRGGGDLPGDVDVGMSRSTDGGRTWGAMKLIMDMGDDPEWRYDGIGDPAVLVDSETDVIWVAATWSHGNRSWTGSGPGIAPEETGQLMLVRSDDDGLTWSSPINITAQVKDPEWCFLLQGPGKGITMRDGTLVFAAQYQDPPENKRLPHSTIIYSKDHGETWHVGTGAFDDTTEAQVVEVEPGVLMLNCRYNRESVRVVMTTRDLGRTWQEHTTSQSALIEPRSCMASLIDVDREAGKDVGNWLLFSNPDSVRARARIMIKASPDGGLTWPKQHRLLLDEGRGRGYSCMSMIDEGTIGILYEGSQADLCFQRIPLADLVQRKGAPAAARAR